MFGIVRSWDIVSIDPNWWMIDEDIKPKSSDRIMKIYARQGTQGYVHRNIYLIVLRFGVCVYSQGSLEDLFCHINCLQVAMKID